MTDDTILPAVDCLPSVDVVVVGPLTHRCPYRDEVDEGTVRIEWSTAGSTFELHALRDYLDQWATRKVSHEEIAVAIRDDLDVPGVENLIVVVDYPTAGFGVRVRSADV